MNLSVMHLNALAQRCHATAVAHGFWDDRDVNSATTGFLAIEALRICEFGRTIEKLRNGELGDAWQFSTSLYGNYTSIQIEILSKLVLIVSEVAEAIDAILDGTGNLDEELADILIRTLDTAEGCGFDIGHATVKKMTVNDSRPRMHNRLA